MNEDTDNLPELPEGWIWVRLEDLVSLLGDGLHGTPKYSDQGDYFFINGNNLSDGKILINNNTKRASIDEYNRYKKKLDERTVLVSINGTLGNVAFYNNEKIILGKSACYFNLLHSINKFYLKLLINTSYFSEYASKNATGSTIKNLSLKSMRLFLVPLPPLAEQHRIVAKIEELSAEAKTIRISLEKVQPILQRFRQSVFASAFRGELVMQDPMDEPSSVLLERIQEERKKKMGKKYREPEPVDTDGLQELPEGWVWVRLKDLLKLITDGSHYSPPTQLKGYPYITVRDISNDRIDFDNCKYISEENYVELKRNGCEPIKNDVLFSKDGTVGKVTVIDYDREFVILSSLAILRPYTFCLNSYYLKHLLKSQMVLNQAINFKTGTAIKRIILKNIENIIIPFSPLPEQHRIVAKIEELFSFADEIEQSVQKGKKRTDYLEQSILAKAFRGELVPQDPNDEPASVLLERIKAEREKTKNSKKGRK